MSCCDGKPVRLNHLNDGIDHLADDIPIRNEMANAFVETHELTRTKIINRSTRINTNVETTTEIIEGNPG